MKLKVNYSSIEFEPESNEDWFDLGRVTKNLGVHPKRNCQPLVPIIDKVEIPFNIILVMLAEGTLTKKEKG